MTPSQKCYDLIKKFEGCKLEAYRDPVGIFTIGFGATGVGVREGVKWTQDQANYDLAQRVEAIGRIINFKVKPIISQNQFDALCSFVYNVGVGAFSESTMVRLLNERKFDQAADQFLRWDKAKGKVLAGLTRRRQAERELFLL